MSTPTKITCLVFEHYARVMRRPSEITLKVISEEESQAIGSFRVTTPFTKGEINGRLAGGAATDIVARGKSPVFVEVSGGFELHSFDSTKGVK